MLIRTYAGSRLLFHSTASFCKQTLLFIHKLTQTPNNVHILNYRHLNTPSRWLWTFSIKFQLATSKHFTEKCWLSVEINHLTDELLDVQTYLSASAQRAGALAEIIVPVVWRGLQRAHQAVQVIKAPICRQLFQGWQGAAGINAIIGLSGSLEWKKWRPCLIDDVRSGRGKFPRVF